ncbi:MAG: DUF2382 domain-containing protein [Caldilinea sp. CFX5]|nr:DUF2382 domain-containing protein [Caldilinea sp. CFX5]
MDQSAEQVIVIDQDGVRGTMAAHALQHRDQQEVLITYNGDRHVRAPMTMLQREADGSYSLPLRLSTLEANARRLKTGEATVIPVVEEEAHIEKRLVERNRTRITKQVHTEEENIDTPLRQERVQVERVPVERIIDSPVTNHYDGDTLVIPVMEEVLIIEKKLLLKEEVRVTKYVGETEHQETVTLRKEAVTVERTPSS